MVLVDIIKYRLYQKTKKISHSHAHGGPFLIVFFPFGLCNAPSTFQREMLGIFYDLIDECVEIYRDDFYVYGDTFKEALDNLEKVDVKKLTFL
jgi:hypothetical protein